MANFSQAIVKVLAAEGGYQNFASDRGNYNAYTADGEFLRSYEARQKQGLRAGTNWGISAGFYSGVLKREVSVEEMKDLTKADAQRIYKQYFWDRMNGDAINNQHLAEIIFDGYVNHGRTGNRMLQRVLNAMGKNLQVDGIIGPISVAAINAANVNKLLCSYVAARRKFYQTLARRVPSQLKFLRGWLNRLDKYMQDYTCTLPAQQNPAQKANGTTGLALAVGLAILLS